MYLFEMKDLPKKAGKAILNWDQGVSNPVREGRNIALPNDEHIKFYTLAGGKQFLMVERYNRGIWFGGTDEEPFLVSMSDKLDEEFIRNRGSEEKLYQSLVPQEILSFSQKTGIPYKRQGDIFAVRTLETFTPQSREAFNAMGFTYDIKDACETRLFNTRHTLTGVALTIRDERGNVKNTLLKGRLEAPDHKPLMLTDAFYEFGQTRYLVDPSKAD